VAAYLDGELASDASILFEQHIAQCRACQSALNEQKRLLCLLDIAFEKPESQLALPENFARVVTAHAQTDLSGMRQRSERRRALLLCVPLFVASVWLLGLSTFDAALASLARFGRGVLGVFGILGHALGDAAAGASLILRTVGGRFLAEPNPLSFLTCMFFACAVALLLRLIVGYHRTRG
jgi:anti-sigma factor RsiW